MVGKRVFVGFLCLVSFLACESLAQETAAATGFVRVEKTGGVWWFVGPDGERFVSMGVNHVEPHLWLAPYNREQTLERYGSDFVDSEGRFNTHGSAATKWIDRQVQTAKDLGFNTFGKHTHPAIDPGLYRDQVYYVASLETAPLAGWRERKGEGPRPDVFSRDFRAYLEDRIASVCREHRGQRRLIGYLYTDAPSWILGRAEQRLRGDTTMIYPWINAILALGDSSPGKQRWLKHLAERYDNAEAAAKAWGLPVSPAYGVSWKQLARQVDWTNPAEVESAQADLLSFMPIIVEQWYSLHEELIRKHDPDHLILGDKNIVNWYYDWMFPSLKDHVDVICTQGYGRWSDESKLYERIYRATGKPIFNGDGCFGFAGPRQQEWGVKGFRTGAKSYQDVAAMYEETLTGMMSTPYMIGWHHCGYLQQWDAAERGDSPRNENGFLDPAESYVRELTDVVQRANAKAERLHQSSAE